MTTPLPEALAFTCPLDLDAILVRLNAAGPWRWTLRDSDTYGDYLIARPTPIIGTKVRLFHQDGGRYVADLTYDDESLGHGLTHAQLVAVMRDQILPSLGAAAVTPTQAY